MSQFSPLDAAAWNQLSKDSVEQRTSFPSSVVLSLETLVAKAIAATLRGWVTATTPWRPIPAS